MKSVALRTKIITGIITGGILLSSVSLAFATGIKSTKTDVKTPSKIEVKQPKADALKASEQVQRDAQRQKNLDAKLAKLVTDKTITQDQSDKIKAAIATQEAANKVEKEKTKTMTKAERKSYIDSNKTIHISALKALVDAGTITQAQADKVGPAGAIGGPGKHGKNMKHGAIDPTLKLAKLVTDKTITQDQSDKIKAAIVTQEAANKVEMEKTKTMTAAERKSYMESKKGTHISALKALVNAGTITQAQADKVGHGANNHMAGIKIK
ncbi:hypothetical protein E4V42_00635 [Clostridium estertheticum]|uniref:Uncharacterized protein n=1 Tax=Clostridium estertheticum TaxID=238834 RepID=A0A5N7IVY9_9CLOT|nr:hypothetical protein [Clostridium estertheticum]MPQ29951.1 hypothetical protein [Clostridium estertheticum]MPQ60627.1 hypothetical protein [Clostridium estertheticum]